MSLVSAESLAFPFVSIIVPVYNAREAVRRCVESLLAQDYPRERYEVIVADNGSTDDSAEIAGEFNIRVVRADRAKGSYVARNDGAREAKGDLFAFCDADEVASPSWLSRLVPEMKEGYGGVAGALLAAKTGMSGPVAEYASGDAIFRPSDRPVDIRLVPTGNVLYRRDVFETLGGFREDTLTGADFDFSLRVTSRLGLRIRFVPDAVVWHQPRTSLGGLLRHEARIAYGREWVCEQHGEAPGSMGAILAALAVKTSRSTAAAAATILREPLRGASWRRAALILIHPLMMAANGYGRLRYRLNLPVPRHW